MDISYFTSDNSNFDDFYDSQTATKNVMDGNVGQNGGTDFTEVEVHLPSKEYFHEMDSNGNASNLYSTPNKNYQLGDVNGSVAVVSNNIQKLEQDIIPSSQPAQYSENIIAGPSGFSSANLSPICKLDIPINAKEVDDDDLISALFLCEKNYVPKTEPDLSSSTLQVSANDSDQRHYCDTDKSDDKYQDLQYYLEMVTGKTKPNIVKSTNNMVTSGFGPQIKDYSSENPYGHKHKKTFKKSLRHVKVKKTKAIKRLRNNRRKVQRYSSLNVNYSIQRRLMKEAKRDDVYTKFWKDLKIMQLTKHTKRLLSANSSSTTGRRNSKKRKIQLCYRSLRRALSKSNHRRIQSTKSNKRYVTAKWFTVAQLNSKRIGKHQKTHIVSKKAIITKTKRQSVKLSSTRNQHISHERGFVANKNKNKEDYIKNRKPKKRQTFKTTVICNPYVKKDPLYKPSSSVRGTTSKY